MANDCKVHFITSCTQSKSTKLGKPVSLSEIRKTGSINVSEWLDKLLDNSPKAKALNVYTGDHWSVARDIFNKYTDDLWILSAGYGLINANCQITKYDATFATGSKNSIGANFALDLPPNERNRRWWNELVETNHISLSIEDLFTNHKGDIFIIAAAPAYLKVVQESIINCISAGVIDADHLLIVSSDIHSALNTYSVKTKEKLRTHNKIKGSLISLNNRVARYLLKEGQKNQFSLSKMKKAHEVIESEIQDVIRPPVKKLSDDEVLEKIRVKLTLTTATKTSASVLLRQFRDEGFSCEQKRFFRLYQSANNTKC